MAEEQRGPQAPDRHDVPRTLVDANRVWVDSLPRALAQRLVEWPALQRLGGPVAGARVLELGPGRLGVGTRLAVEAGAAHVDAVELHPASAQAARRALSDLGERVQVRQGDASRLEDLPDAAYDVVLGYHVLHHAVHWRDVVAEAARVLRPGGRLLVAEMTARIVDSRLLRAVSHHPRDGDRPTPVSLAAAVEAAGLSVRAHETRYAGWWTALAAERR